MPDRIDLLIDMQRAHTQSLDGLHTKLDEFQIETEHRLTKVEERSEQNRGWIKRVGAALATIATGALLLFMRTLF